MIFGPVDIESAEGAVLAHSVTLPSGRLGKGKLLTLADIDALREAGIGQVTVSRLGPGDIDENTAAAQIGAAACGPGMRLSDAFTGRVNLIATGTGVLRVDTDAIHALNMIDEAITLACLPDYARVSEGALIATVKIIPYGVAADVLARARAALPDPPFTLHPFQGGRADLILTQTPGMKDSVLEKGQRVTETRMRALGFDPGVVHVVEHSTEAVARALSNTAADCVLILTASATSDRADVAPAALVAAGGELTRFGMPVDPGNLLFLGMLGGRQIVGLPGCARSPALNGADWVLERIAAGIGVTDDAIARMGVGGMLKEIPARPQPRAAKPKTGTQVEIILLAAGASRRMEGRDKLLEDAGGMPLLRRTALAATGSGAARIHVVLPEGHADRRGAIQGLDLEILETRDFAEGMAGSLRAGISALSPDAGAVIIALADMPDLTPDHYDRLIAAWRKSNRPCRAASDAGEPGHPVLFPQRYFESLAGLSGDRGAREILKSLDAEVQLVPTLGQGATTDLDTPDAWAAWRQTPE